MTEHNALWPPGSLRALSEQVEMTVLAGMELGTDAGHVLVYGLDRYRPELLILDRLRRIVESEGAAMVLAHPMRPFHGPRPAADTYASWFDGVETINGDHSDSEHGYLVREAETLGLASVGGSDAHSRQAVGRVATAFRHPVRTVSDVVDQLRRVECFAVDFRT